MEPNEKTRPLSTVVDEPKLNDGMLPLLLLDTLLTAWGLVMVGVGGGSEKEIEATETGNEKLQPLSELLLVRLVVKREDKVGLKPEEWCTGLGIGNTSEPAVV